MLQQWVRSGKTEQRVAWRRRMVLAMPEGLSAFAPCRKSRKRQAWGTAATLLAATALTKAHLIVWRQSADATVPHGKRGKAILEIRHE